MPGDDIVTDATAEARYNSALEAWGDRKLSAGQRLCRFYKALDMRGDC